MTKESLGLVPLDFVFGEADPVSGLAIISLSRLSKADAWLNRIMTA